MRRLDCLGEARVCTYVSGTRQVPILDSRQGVGLWMGLDNPKDLTVGYGVGGCGTWAWSLLELIQSPYLRDTTLEYGYPPMVWNKLYQETSLYGLDMVWKVLKSNISQRQLDMV